MPENYRCLLIDDEPNATQALAAMIAMKCPQLLVLEQINSAKDAVEKIQKWKPDLIFLDVEMPFLNGFELLQQLPNIDFQVIFTTSHEKYAIRAIKFAAIDYLLKPIDLEELQASVAKFEKQKKEASIDSGIEQFKQLFQNLQSQTQGYTKISLPTFEGLRIVTLTDIIRCEGDGSYTTFHLNTGEKIVSSKNLKEYEELLESTHFMRVHNSHIINLKEVAAYTKGDGGFVTLNDKSSVDIARRRKEAFLEKIKHLF